MAGVLVVLLEQVAQQQRGAAVGAAELDRLRRSAPRARGRRSRAAPTSGSTSRRRRARRRRRSPPAGRSGPAARRPGTTCTISREHDARRDAAPSQRAQRLARGVDGELGGERGDVGGPVAQSGVCAPSATSTTAGASANAASLIASSSRCVPRAPRTIDPIRRADRRRSDQQRHHRRRQQQQHRHEDELRRHDVARRPRGTRRAGAPRSTTTKARGERQRERRGRRRRAAPARSRRPARPARTRPRRTRSRAGRRARPALGAPRRRRSVAASIVRACRTWRDGPWLNGCPMWSAGQRADFRSMKRSRMTRAALGAAAACLSRGGSGRARARGRDHQVGHRLRRPGADAAVQALAGLQRTTSWSTTAPSRTAPTAGRSPAARASSTAPPTQRVSGAGRSKSLLLPAGSSATTPPVCVGLNEPTLRYFARKNSGLLSTLTVSVQVQLELGGRGSRCRSASTSAARGTRACRTWCSPTCCRCCRPT